MAVWTEVVAGEILGDTQGDAAGTQGGQIIVANPNPWVVVAAFGAPVVVAGGQLDFSNPDNSVFEVVTE